MTEHNDVSGLAVGSGRLRPWRVGRSVGRTIYDASDELIGIMDTRELAAQVVAAVNCLATDDAGRSRTPYEPCEGTGDGPVDQGRGPTGDADPVGEAIA